VVLPAEIATEEMGCTTPCGLTVMAMDTPAAGAGPLRLAVKVAGLPLATVGGLIERAARVSVVDCCCTRTVAVLELELP